jgi:hypothetical protein
MHFLKVMFYLFGGYTQDKIPVELFIGHINAEQRINITYSASCKASFRNICMFF